MTRRTPIDDTQSLAPNDVIRLLRGLEDNAALGGQPVADPSEILQPISMHRLVREVTHVLTMGEVRLAWDRVSDVEQMRRELTILRGVNGPMLAAILRDAEVDAPTTRDVEIARECYAADRRGGSWAELIATVKARVEQEQVAA